MADRDVAVARECAKICFALYDGCAFTESLYWSARKLFRHGSRLRAKIIDFSNGAPPGAKLRRFLGRFKLMLTCNAHVEGLHAQVPPPIQRPALPDDPHQ